MEVRDSAVDAIEARNRCLEAMVQSDDIPTRTSLWRASLRYARLARERGGERDAGELASPSPIAVGRSE
jgi:hypothetical protein